MNKLSAFLELERVTGVAPEGIPVGPTEKLHDCDLHTALSLGSLRQAIAADAISKFAEKQLRELEPVR
jgi:hypothetical protein